MTRSATARSSPGGLGTAASSRNSSSTSDTEAQDSQRLLAVVDVPLTSSWQLLVKAAAPAKPARPPDGAASVASSSTSLMGQRTSSWQLLVKTAAPAKPARPPDGAASVASSSTSLMGQRTSSWQLLVKTAAPAKPARPPDGAASVASSSTSLMGQRTSSWQLLVKTAAPAKPARPPDGAASVASARELYPIAPAFARTAERGLDELAEERRRPRRPRLELRMELRGDEPRVVRQLDDLDQAPLLEGAADDEAGVDEPLAVGVVDLVTVPVAFGDHRLAAVDVTRPGAVDELDRLRPQAHRAAEILDVLLLGQEVDHRVRRLGIHLGRVGAVEVADVTRELGDGDVHAEADAEIGDRLLARDAAGAELPFPAARAEAARDEHAVDAGELGARLLERHVFRVDPAHTDAAARRNARVLQRLVHRQVGVVELHVLADERDLHRLAARAE